MQLFNEDSYHCFLKYQNNPLHRFISYEYEYLWRDQVVTFGKECIMD